MEPGYLAWVSGGKMASHGGNMQMRFQMSLKWSPGERYSLFVAGLLDTSQYVDGSR